MSTALLVAAFIVAVLSVPTIGGLTAWALAGGDGETKNWFLGILAMLVGFGAVFTAVMTFRTFFQPLPEWAWWAMWAPPVAGLLGLVLISQDPDEPTGSVTDWLTSFAMQAGLAVPAVLVWLAGAA